MSIENIIEKISSETEEKKVKILKESGRKCREILAMSEKEAKKIKEEMLLSCCKKIKEEHSRKILLTNLEIKKEQLSEKRKILDEIYLEAHKKLNGLSREKIVKIISEKLMENAFVGDEVSVSAKYKDNFPKPANVKIKFDDIDSIFIIKKATSEIRFSFEELISELKEKTERKLSEILLND
ncbi:MAG: hypothetical protein HY919_00475 [Elusimicrobia bacterium]|nr:hypothetical protein [Elusimicrobiota bacterium]